MDRKYGEKSYNPSKFNINFWGNRSSSYIWRTFERRLPGNVVLAAYEKPVSIEELSLELGVSAPYLEDELEILLKYNFVRKTGNKYQTDFLIFREPFERELQEKIPTAEICREAAARIQMVTESLLSKFKKMNLGIQLDDNQLRWFIVNFTLINALGQFEDNAQKKFGPYPKLNADTCGYIYGHDNDFSYSYFSGIYGHCENSENTAWYTAVNYNVIKKCQFWKGISFEGHQTLCDAILGNPVTEQNNEVVAQLICEGLVTEVEGILKANFPTFTSKQSYLMQQTLKEVIDSAIACTEKFCAMAAEICKKHTPKHLQDRCERLCYICHQADTMGIIVEKLVAEGYLIVPDKPTNLCIFGVKRLSADNR